jgi:hypothetical protein
MKHLLIALLASLSLTASAQQKYDDLLALFVDGKYEKCLEKSEKYTLNDKTSKDALPYLFMSRCYFEMSQRSEFSERYPTAQKECFKFASKYITKDKTRQFYPEHEDYFVKLRTTVTALAETDLDNKKWNSCKAYYEHMTKWDPNDAGALIMMAESLQGAKKGKTDKIIDGLYTKAEKLLQDKTCSVDNEDQLKFLKYALIYHAEMLNSSSSNSEAQKWIELGNNWFGDDKEYQVTYKQIMQ